MANHVYFLSPYLTTGASAEDTYKKAMEQAEGRVVRYGQKKTVHVHKFMVAFTLDIDIFELRENKLIMEVNDCRPTFKDALSKEDTGNFSSRLGYTVLKDAEDDY